MNGCYRQRAQSLLPIFSGCSPKFGTQSCLVCNKVSSKSRFQKKHHNEVQLDPPKSTCFFCFGGPNDQSPLTEELVYHHLAIAPPLNAGSKALPRMAQRNELLQSGRCHLGPLWAKKQETTSNTGGLGEYVSIYCTNIFSNGLEGTPC